MKKPMKPCRKLGCTQLTRESYCENHTGEKKEEAKIYNQTRDQEHVKFYNSKEWKAVRLIALKRDLYLCVKCKEKGTLKPARVVDHIEELKDNYERRLDLDNLMSLCDSCHTTKTIQEKKKRKK